MLDILIKNGTVIDGTGAAAKPLDIGIQDGRVTMLAPNIAAAATQTIDAKDRYVAPGFIDVQNHSDSYWTLFDQPGQISLLAQGITTIVLGNCGASLAPLLSNESIKSIQKWHSLEGINVNWASVTELFDAIGKLPLGVNVGTLIGHATLRRGLLGDKVRALTAEETRVMEKAVIDGLSQGALGLSMGLVYAHEVNSSREELLALVKSLKPQNKYLSVHLRSEGSGILDSLDEVIELANAADIAVKISHLKIRGKKHWALFDRLVSKLEIAYHQGTKISFDVYPYDSSWSVLYTYLPKWAYEGGRANIMATIADSINRRKILDYLKEQGHDYGQIIIADASGKNNFVGKTIHQIAQNQNVSNEEAILNVIAATQAQVVVFDKNLSAEQVELLTFSPLSMIATDGAGYREQVPGLIHPRCFGTMPRFLKMVREKKSIKWEQAIQKITAAPASLLGITDRGTVAVNKAADLVIFDPLTITDRADYTNPDILPEGIDMVFVNGLLAFAKGQIVTPNGLVIKR